MDPDSPAPRLEPPPTYPERRRRPPVRLRGSARRALMAAAEVVAPARCFGFDPAAYCLEFVEDYLSYLPRPLRRLFPIGLLALEWSAVPITGRRFSRLDVASRRSLLERAERSRALFPLAITWPALRGILACAIYSRPELARAIGYDHQTWLDAKVRERRARFGVPEPW